MSDLLNNFKVRYEGTRWKVICRSYESVEKFAVNELQRMMESYFPYVIRVEIGIADLNSHEDYLLLVGDAYFLCYTGASRWTRSEWQHGRKGWGLV